MAVTAPETERTTTFAQARAAADEFARFVAELEIDRFSVEDSRTLARFFTTVERTAQAGKAKALARAARADIHFGTPHRSAAEALAAETGDSVGETKDLVQLAEDLADQPEVEQAFRDGELSKRRATLVTGAVKVAPNKQSELVEAAKTETEAQLKERCLRVKAAARTKEDEERHQKKLHAQRMARTYTDHDGALCLTAKFTPEVGAEVKAAIEAQADRQFEQARREGREESPAAYRADAVSALITGKGILGPLGRKPGAAGTPGAATTSTGDGSTGPGPTATTSGPGQPAAPNSPTERPSDPKATLSVVVDLEALRRGQVGDGERCEIPGVGPVPVDYATDLLGEALVELLIAKGTDVTTVYSAGRHIPQRVRSALLLRDPRCVVPGCDARLGLENDHWVTDFAKGGLTALDNLARLCRRHHRDRTHHGYELEKDGDTWIWIAPAHPFTPKRPRPKKKTGPRSNGKAPPTDPEPSLFDEDPPPRKE
jgi:hypothetical protein